MSRSRWIVSLLSAAVWLVSVSFPAAAAPCAEEAAGAPGDLVTAYREFSAAASVVRDLPRASSGVPTGRVGSAATVDIPFLDGSFYPLYHPDLGWQAQVRCLIFNDGTVPVSMPVVMTTAFDSADNYLGAWTDDSTLGNVGARYLYPDDVSAVKTSVMTPGHQPSDVWVEATARSDTAMPFYLSTECQSDGGGGVRTYSAHVTNWASVPSRGARVSVAEWRVSTGEFWDCSTSSVPTETAVPAGGSVDVSVRLDRAGASGSDIEWFAWAQGEKAEPTQTATARVAGANRYATAAAAAARAFPDGAGTVVLVSGRSFADALSASALAGAYRGPLLLTAPDKLSPETATALESLDTTHVVIVGGAGAVSTAAQASIAGALGAGGLVERISGSDRYATSALVCEQVHALSSEPATQAFVVRGDAFPDALAVSPFAYSQTMPLLLVRTATAPQAVVDAAVAAGIGKLWVVGGTGAVSNAAVAEFGIPAMRLAGANRYATGALACLLGHDEGWTGLGTLGLANGRDYPDALTAGPALGVRGGALLLSDASLLPRDSGAVLLVSGDHISTLVAYGGVGSLGALPVTTAYRLCP